MAKGADALEEEYAPPALEPTQPVGMSKLIGSEFEKLRMFDCQAHTPPIKPVSPVTLVFTDTFG